MNFTPLFHNVQLAIKNDNHILLKEIYNNAVNENTLDLNDFNSFYSEFLLITSHYNSFKCLDFLMNKFQKRFDSSIASAMNRSIEKSNDVWLDTFLTTFFENKNNNQELYLKNCASVWADIDSDKIALSKKETFNLLLKHINNNKTFFSSHLVCEFLLEKNKINRLNHLLAFFKDNDISTNDILKDSIVSKSLQYERLSFLDSYMLKENISFNTPEKIRQAFESVGFAGSVKSLNYLTKTLKYDLTLNNKNNGFLVDAAIRTSKISFIEYYFEAGGRLYNNDNKINQYFIALRQTAWEDIQYSHVETQVNLILSIKKLIEKYEPENKKQFINELKDSAFPDLSSFIEKEALYKNLDKKLIKTRLPRKQIKI
jgi:hypothetical protein